MLPVLWHSHQDAFCLSKPYFVRSLALVTQNSGSAQNDRQPGRIRSDSCGSGASQSTLRRCQHIIFPRPSTTTPPVSMTEFNPSISHLETTTTFAIETMYSRQEYRFSVPISTPLLEEDDVHLLLLRSRITRARILRRARFILTLIQGPIFVSHPLLTIPYLLWKGTRTRELRYQARRSMKGSIFQ